MRSDSVASLMQTSLAQSSDDPLGEIQERARETTRVLRDLVPSDAFALCAWDPRSRTHIHQDLVSDGYSRATLDHINDEYVADNPAYQIQRTEVRKSLLWRDVFRDFEVDFSRTAIAEEHLLPAGLKEGLTACLWLPDGRYVGAFHANWESPRGVPDEERERIERFRPLLAAACDLLRHPRILLLQLAPNGGAIMVGGEGNVLDAPEQPPGPALSGGSRLRSYFESSPRQPRRQFLWPGEDSWFRIEVLPCRDGTVLVTEQTIEAPYRLTARELEILHLVASGSSNLEIGERLYVSRRTVSTHVEHILAKLGCASRTELAAKAVDEGLLLVEEPRG